ncbi:hypothetical protein ERJ75_001460100 [Trypanosoma vivax]|nr:hypothetical protein ERJ75_001460100 [Trypanosoma vivax]
MSDTSFQVHTGAIGTIDQTYSTSENNAKFLETFIRIYARECEDHGMEMNQLAVQSAVITQSSLACNGLMSYTLTGVSLGMGGSYALFSTIANFCFSALNLSDCYVGDNGIRILTDILSTSPHIVSGLRNLQLSSTGITDGAPLATFVFALRQLRLLDVSRNKLGVDSAGLTLLCRVMQQHPALLEVRLADNMISGCCFTSVDALAQWIVASGQMCILTHVDVRFNTLGLSQEGAFCGATAEGEAPRSIYGSHPIADALLLNNTLETFEVSGNSFSTTVCNIIEAKLSVNRRTKKCLSCTEDVTRI